MTLSAKATLTAMKLPTVVEKDGRRYSLDIVDDATGVDLVIERQNEGGNEDEGEE